MATKDERWRRRTLGETGLTVSALGIGTVELGMRYGLPVGGELPPLPPLEASVALLHEAFRRGIDFIDTAPGYGRAEEIVGAAIAGWNGPRPTIATKVFCPSLAELTCPPALRRGIRRAIEASLRRLRLPRIQVLQVHNATVDAFESPELAEVLREMVEMGLVEHLGASTYGERAARAAIAAPWCETIQLAYNVLDQEPAGRLVGLASGARMGIIARSALLKGVLAGQQPPLPRRLEALRPQLEVAAGVSRSLGETVAQTALRFVLSDPRVSTVIAGIDRPAYLEEDLAAWRAPPLPPHARAALAAAHAESPLTDPRTWGF